MLITRGGKNTIIPNFSEYEFRSRSWDKGFSDIPDYYEMSNETIKVLNFIRNEVYPNEKIIINSTLRSQKHNSSTIGASSMSYHLPRVGKDQIYDHNIHTGSPLCYALDFKFVNKEAYERFIHDYHNNGLKEQLKYLGLKAIGFYDTFIHIDSGVGYKRHQFQEWGSKKKI